MTGETSSADTKMSLKVTTTSVMFGSISFRLQKKSREGPDTPNSDRNCRMLPLNVAELVAVEFALFNTTRTFIGWRSEILEDPCKLRTLIPLISTNLSGDTKSGGCLKSKVKQVSRCSEEKKRGGQL